MTVLHCLEGFWFSTECTTVDSLAAVTRRRSRWTLAKTTGVNLAPSNFWRRHCTTARYFSFLGLKVKHHKLPVVEMLLPFFYTTKF